VQTVLFVVGTLAIAIITAASVVLVRGILREMRGIGQVARDLSHFLKTAEEELTGTAHDTRAALNNVERLVGTINETVVRVSRVAEVAERVLDAAFLANTAVKAVKSSTVGLTSVYEGVKQGIKTLCGYRETNKGGTSDE